MNDHSEHTQSPSAARLAGQLEATRSRLIDATEARQAAEAHARELERELEREREERRRTEQRASWMREGVGDLRGVTFGGDLHDLILRLCMLITEAQRGAYLGRDRDAGPWRIRASHEMEDSEEFLRAVAERVSTVEPDSLRLGQDELPAFPDAGVGEPIRSCLAAPVVILNEFDGVIVVADKRWGEFHDEDASALLSIGDDASVAARNTELQRELEVTYGQVVRTLAAVIHAQDAPTHDHSEHAADLAARTAWRLGLGPEECAISCYAALLHDIGKIGVDPAILNKPGPLTEKERAAVRRHVVTGRDIVARIPALAEVADAVYHHHEWHDGSGYPQGLAGDAIPVPAAIVAVVDAFSAMTSERSYKQAYSVEFARRELRAGSGRQFRPDVVDAFIHVIDEAGGAGDPEEAASRIGRFVCDLAPAVEVFWERRRSRRADNGAAPAGTT